MKHLSNVWNCLDWKPENELLSSKFDIYLQEPYQKLHSTVGTLPIRVLNTPITNDELVELRSSVKQIMEEMNSDIMDRNGTLGHDIRLADLIALFELSPAILCLGLRTESLQGLDTWYKRFDKDPEVSELQKELREKYQGHCNIPPTLYGDTLSAQTNAVRSLMESVGMDYCFQPQEMTQEEQNLDLHRGVPTFVQGSVRLNDTIAILGYICDTYEYDMAQHWYPKNFRERAKVNQFLSWYQVNLKIYIDNIVAGKVFAKKARVSFLPWKILQAEAELPKSLENLDKILSQQKNAHVTGPEATIADLVAIAGLGSLRCISYDLKPYKELNKWYKDLYFDNSIRPCFTDLESLK